jgi:ubiquinone/menaquinone biosynthesis C-methylase UbiE
VYPLFTKLGFLSFGGERKARKAVLDQLDLKGGRLLEVSIGTGGNLPFLFETGRVGEVCGLDVSAGQLGRCRRLVEKRCWPVDLCLGTAEVLPFKACAFDSVLHIGGINFFSGRAQAVDEMIRVARPGAKIVIADEAVKIARNMYRLTRLFKRHRGAEIDFGDPVRLVPETMEDIRMEGIWKSHGEYHGYCLEFRKPVDLRGCEHEKRGGTAGG